MLLLFGDVFPTALNITLVNTTDTEVECCQTTTKPKIREIGLAGGEQVGRLEKWRTTVSKDKTFDNYIVFCAY